MFRESLRPGVPLVPLEKGSGPVPPGQYGSMEITGSDLILLEAEEEEEREVAMEGEEAVALQVGPHDAT